VKREGPFPLQTSNSLMEPATNAASVSVSKNLLWIITRTLSKDIQHAPGFTGFNILTRDSLSSTENEIGYLPTINSPATQLNTVFEIMHRSEAIRTELNLQHIVIVMDQALYAKAMQIAWANKEIFQRIVIRMGAFHTICNSLCILGLRFKDAGLVDLVLETNLVAEGSTTKVFDGKNYKRAVRVHKIIYESLMRIMWFEFQKWVSTDQAEMLKSCVAEILLFSDDINQIKFEELLDSDNFIHVQELWIRFTDYLREENGPLSSYWMTYIDFVEKILLALIRAAREGDWMLHLSALRTLIPWTFAYDSQLRLFFTSVLCSNDTVTN